MKVLILIFSLFSLCSAKFFINPYPRFETHIGEESEAYGSDFGVPLYLTPLLNDPSQKIEDIQNLAKVEHQELGKFNSYSGYFTVNPAYNSSLFFWYFKAQSDEDNAPVILWLQGGPGASSLFGLFTENGPIDLTNGKVNARKYSWNQKAHLIFIDNPCGTGFSEVKDDRGYARNEEDVGKDLYNALLQFFTLFPHLQKNDFYVTGESYGGKYVPAISHTIHKNNGNAKLKINLKGLAIGNGLCDPVHQMVYGDYLYQLGLIDSHGRETFHEYEKKGTDCIKKKDFDCAFDVFDELINMDQLPSGSLFKNMTGFDTYFNYLQPGGDDSDQIMATFLKRADIRKAIHVGKNKFHGLDGDENKVEEFLKKDVMNTVAPYLTELLHAYRVVIYNGQLDIIVAYPTTVNYLKHLNFDKAKEYKTAPRYIWKVDGEIAGYVKEAGNLVEVMVRSAGHMVPANQPKWAFDLISRLISGKSFH